MAMAAMAKATSIVLAMVVLVLAMASLVEGTKGFATFYTPRYTPSACYGNQDKGTMIAAASEMFWNGGVACGDWYVVTCKGAANEGVPHPCTGRSIIV